MDFSRQRNCCSVQHSARDLGQSIKRLYKHKAFWSVMLDESEAQSGPSDGGCLIAAKAIIHANDGGDLVRIISDIGIGIEHYGARIDGRIYDFNGVFSSPQSWIKKFKSLENINDRKLVFAEGYDEKTVIPDDPAAVKKVAAMIVVAMAL
jgi:hypothetical protein